jgi:AcrR family transcriptional regulator
MNPESSDKGTKATLIDCAERLFLEKGFENVSIRQITDQANANVAAVNYHFSGKTNLYREVLSHRFDEIARHKVALLKNLQTETDNLQLRDVISTYVHSFFEDTLTPPDSDRLMQIIYREMGPDAVAADLVTDRLVTPIHRALRTAILKIEPDMNKAHISRCISSITGQVLHFVRAREVIMTVSMPGAGPKFAIEATQHITEFSLRGIASETDA